MTFDADIRFDRLTPQVDLRVVIDTASIDTGGDDRDKEACGPAYLATDSHPRAIFEAGDVTGADGRFEARGTLTI